MNTEINQNHGTGNGIAFLFGAIFNLLADIDLTFLIDYVSQAIVGGIICLAFKILGDVLSPLWQKHKDRVRDFTRLSKFKKRLKRRKSDDQE